jgi:hypothetical protein
MTVSVSYVQLILPISQLNAFIAFFLADLDTDLFYVCVGAPALGDVGWDSGGILLRCLGALLEPLGVPCSGEFCHLDLRDFYMFWSFYHIA